MRPGGRTNLWTPRSRVITCADERAHPDILRRVSDARLYGMSISHPSRAARLMLEHKGIEYRLVNVPVGLQAGQIRLAGFKAGTVPALRIDGRRAVGTLAISRLLDELRP